MPRTAASEVSQRLVGEAVRRARITAGLTQAQLADRLSVSPAYVTNIEAGRTNLTIGQLGNIASALGAHVRIDLDLSETPALSAPA